MPFAIVKEYRFAAAHFIPDHPGKCRRLHGHNYRVRVELGADELDRLGMVLDFAEVKKLLDAAAGRFDHRLLNEMEPFDRINSTAEEIARHLHDVLAGHLSENGRVRVERVEVWEGETSCAIYRP